MTDESNDGLEVGTVMVLHKRGARSLVKISKLTRTQIVVVFRSLAGGDYERRYRRSNGMGMYNEIGASTYEGGMLAVATKADISAIRDAAERRKLIDAVRASTLETLTTDQLTRLAAIVAEPNP